MLQATVLSQILLMQTMLISLPDEQSILNFVCRGLEDVPGISSVTCIATLSEAPSEAYQVFPISVASHPVAWVVMEVADSSLFQDYSPFISNFITMVGIIFGQHRHQQAMGDINQELIHSLEIQHRLHQELILKEKVASLEPMSRVLSHELNTPIGNIIMVSTKVLKSTTDMMRKIPSHLTRNELDRFMESILEATELIGKSAQATTELINRFRKVVSQRVENYQGEFSLREVVEETVRMVRVSQADLSVEVAIDIDPALKINSYPGAIGQMIDHLLTNAFLHGFPGGKSGRVVISAQRNANGDECQLVVQDEGVGIVKDNLVHVFEPFFTTRFGQGGSGLGLSTVYHIVTRILNGHIEIDSSPGEGCRFTVTFGIL